LRTISINLIGDLSKTSKANIQKARKQSSSDTRNRIFASILLVGILVVFAASLGGWLFVRMMTARLDRHLIKLEATLNQEREQESQLSKFRDDLKTDKKITELEKLSNGIEAVLFWKGEPVSIKKLSQIFEKTEEEISTALKTLESNLVNRGVALVYKEDEVALSTSKETAELIEKLTKEELVKDLGKAGLETLSIIIYQSPISRAEIDYIRGVQSNFILRNLMIRVL